jgi:hypothetical protein
MMDINTAAIIVGSNGFVWYTPKVEEGCDHITLIDACIIRVWGTTFGLAELTREGPTKATVLDAKATVILNKQSFLFAIPCKTWSV